MATSMLVTDVEDDLCHQHRKVGKIGHQNNSWNEGLNQSPTYMFLNTGLE